MKLLTTGNAKIEKSLSIGIYTAALHLAPARVSGHNVCAGSTAGCRAVCLHTAGHPMMMAAKEKARIARTQFLFSDRAGFLIALRKEIAAHVRKAKKLGYVPAIRLNATSDIMWEKFLSDGKNIFDHFPDVSYYDYSKIFKPRALPQNVHITYSYSERSNPVQARDWIVQGKNVATVFAIGRTRPMIETWHGMPVIDGDVTDYRPADPRGVIVGLRAKGKARGDKSGFVQSPVP